MTPYLLRSIALLLAAQLIFSTATALASTPLLETVIVTASRQAQSGAGW